MVPHDDKYAWFKVMPRSSQIEGDDVVSYMTMLSLFSHRNYKLQSADSIQYEIDQSTENISIYPRWHHNNLDYIK